jgi:hypothetical protein
MEATSIPGKEAHPARRAGFALREEVVIMRSELKLRGGRVVSVMLQHPLGASVGAVVLGAPCAWIATGAAGAGAGAFMGLIGLVMGAPLGGIVADSAHPETSH